MKVFYHADNDGVFSAHTIWEFLNGCDSHEIATKMGMIGIGMNDSNSHEYKSINYGQPFPIETIKKNELVWIVDYSITPEEMGMLQSITNYVIWIDHHITAIEKYSGYGKKIHGLRKDGVAGCALTWCFVEKLKRNKRVNELYEELNEIGYAPMALQLVADRDVWKWAFGDQSKYFHEAFTSLTYDMCEPGSTILRHLFNYCGQGEHTLNKMLDRGKILDEVFTSKNERYMKSYSYEVEFEGHKVIACNNRGGATAFGEEYKKYPFVISYVHKDSGFIVNMYSDNKDPEFSLIKIGAKHGFAGHRLACGAILKELPFKPIIKEE